MKHLDGGVPCFLGSLDLFRVLVAVADFQGQGVITNVTFDVYTKIDLDAVALLQHHLAVPSFHAFDLMVGGEMGC